MKRRRVRLRVPRPLVRGARLAVSSLAGAHRRTLARRTTVIAVTGASGKTTACRFILAALSLGPENYLAANQRHPNGSRSRFVRRAWGARELVVEVGVERPGEMDSLARPLRPDIAVVMAVGTGGEHAVAYRDPEQAAREKAGLVRALRPGGVAILNGDDPRVRAMANEARGAVILFGSAEGNDVRATDYRLDWPNGSTFTLSVRGQSFAIRTRLLGRVGMYPILASAAVALVRGLPLDAFVEKSRDITGIHGRLQVTELPGGVLAINDDYKGSYDSFEAALDLLAAAPARRKILVLDDIDGPMRPQRPYYRALGERAARIADFVILAERNWQDHRAGLYAGGITRERFIHLQGIEMLTAKLRDILQPGDLVLVKGRQSARLYRSLLALSGRQVRCTIAACPFPSRICEECRYLERGWKPAEQPPFHPRRPALRLPLPE